MMVMQWGEVGGIGSSFSFASALALSNGHQGIVMVVAFYVRFARDK